MRLHRFYIEQYQGNWGTGSVVITDSSLVNQFRNVLRYSEGDYFIGFHGTGDEYQMKIESIDRKSINTSFVEQLKVNTFIKNNNLNNVTMYISLIKKDRFEWMIEKLTELGIKKIVPIISQHTTIKNISLKRLHKISKEAVEQSGQVNLVEIGEPQTLAEALKHSDRKIFCFHTHDSDDMKKQEEINFTKEGENKKTKHVFIGPEGGWSEDDIFLFKENDAKIMHLNTPILRTETAAIVTAVKFIK